MTKLSRRSTSILAVSLLALIAWQCSSDKPSQPTTQKPDITQFSAVGTDIVPGDSTLATYAAVRADSLVLTPGQKLANTVSGSIYLKPAFPTRYVLRAYNAAGQDSLSLQITMSSAAASLTLGLSEDTIVTGDSTTLSYSTLRADSVVLLGIAKLSPVASGTRILKPTANITYTAVAYSPYGNDTVSVAVRVEVPFQIQAPSGGLYRGTMGSSALTPQLRFRVVDFSATTLYKPWIHFTATNGDGILSSDSLKPSSNGFADINYDFSGLLGRVTITAMVRGFDTASVEVRADMLTPGADGQGQYVLFSDTYGKVRAWNGQPASVDVHPQYCILYANYETAKGVVVVLEDNPCDGVANDDEPVTGVIVNTVYTGKTVEGIGVGSTYAQITAAYGQPDSVYIDPSPPPALTLEYWSKGIIFFCGQTDSAAFEIHFTELVAGSTAAKNIDAQELRETPVSIQNRMPRYRYGW